MKGRRERVTDTRRQRWVQGVGFGGMDQGPGYEAWNLALGSQRLRFGG